VEYGSTARHHGRVDPPPPEDRRWTAALLAVVLVLAVVPPLIPMVRGLVPGHPASDMPDHLVD